MGRFLLSIDNALGLSHSNAIATASSCVGALNFRIPGATAASAEAVRRRPRAIGRRP